MATICLASDKGGVAKTTLTLLLGAEFALTGLSVTILDADLNQSAASFGRKAGVPGLRIESDITEANILASLRAAEARSDVVLIDLPGGSSTLALKSMHRSHLAIVPTQPSLPDARAALSTLAQLDDAQELAGVPIARVLIWTRVPAAIESRVARHVRATLEAQPGVSFLRAMLVERAAYRQIHLTGRVPRQDDPTGRAAANVSALSTELLTRLSQLRKFAA